MAGTEQEINETLKHANRSHCHQRIDRVSSECRQIDGYFCYHAISFASKDQVQQADAPAP